MDDWIDMSYNASDMAELEPMYSPWAQLMLT